MSLQADAELLWGIPVLAFDEDGEPTKFWDAENDDWREFESELEIRSYGHYEDPNNTRGILTSTRVGRYRASCWVPERVSGRDLDNESANDKLYSKSNDEAAVAGLDVNFYADAGWWLVASFG